MPTFRRAHLLGRALDSLRAQSCADWVAEVHNDAPDDPRPEAVVRERGDPRISYVRHERTLGGAAALNLAFECPPQPFVALLEDDNWWQPRFLETMLAALRNHPDVTVAWSNQSVWEETPTGDWRDAQRLVRPPSASTEPIRVSWPRPAQCFGALHAHGTILVRTRPGQHYATPETDLGAVEGMRERAFPHPLLYVPQPLGVFGATLRTHRSCDPSIWATNQVLLAASFLKHVAAAPSFWSDLWRRARAATPRMTDTLLLATRQDPALRQQLRWAQAQDWRHLAVRSTRRPLVFIKLLRARDRAPAVWRFLDAHTAARAEEAANQGRATPAAEEPVLS